MRFRILSVLALLCCAGVSQAAITQRRDGLVLCSAGDTFTLPTAANKPGRQFRVKNTGPSTCTVGTTSAQTIDGLGTWKVQPGQAITFTSDAGNWLSSDTASMVTSGQAIAAGNPIGFTDSSGSARAMKACADASAPVFAAGIAASAASGSGETVAITKNGLSGVIPDAAWDSVPTAASVGAKVFLSKTAGKLTTDTSAFAIGDIVQQVGLLAAGGTGACKVEVKIGTPTPLATISTSATQATDGGTNLDLSVAVAADQEITFVASGYRTTGQSAENLRINGGAASVFGGAYYSSSGTAVWTGFLMEMGAVGNTYEGAGCRVRIGKAINGRRSVDFTYWSKAAGWCGGGSGVVTAGALTSVGFADAGSGIAAGANITAVVGQAAPNFQSFDLTTPNVSAGGAYQYNKTNVIRALTALHSYYFGPSGNLTATGQYNLFGGDDAGASTTSGGNKLLLGPSAGKDGTTASNKIALGVGAGEHDIDGDGNIEIGVLSGHENLHGKYRTCTGHLSCQNSTADYVTCTGMHCGTFLTTGSQNTGDGAGSLRSTTSGNYNTGSGFHSCALNGTGNGNTCNGHQSGFPDAAENAEAVGDDYMTYDGANSGRVDGVTGKMTNGIAIGYNTRVPASNTAVLGNTDITRTILRGTVEAPYFQVTTAPVANSTGTVTISGMTSSSNVGNAGWIKFKTSAGVIIAVPYWTAP